MGNKLPVIVPTLFSVLWTKGQVDREYPSGTSSGGYWIHVHQLFHEGHRYTWLFLLSLVTTLLVASIFPEVHMAQQYRQDFLKRIRNSSLVFIKTEAEKLFWPYKSGLERCCYLTLKSFKSLSSNFVWQDVPFISFKTIFPSFLFPSFSPFLSSHLLSVHFLFPSFPLLSFHISFLPSTNHPLNNSFVGSLLHRLIIRK